MTRPRGGHEPARRARSAAGAASGLGLGLDGGQHGSHPQAGLARRQLRSTGGLLTFDLRGGNEAALRFVGGLRICRMAPSLGGPDTLVAHPASSSHAGLRPEELDECGISPGTVRLSAGLEDTADVVADVLDALAAR